MTEQVSSDGPDANETAEPDRAEPTRTGVPRVDAVLADVERLDELPLEEHAAVFERAHESLRGALDEAPDHDGSEHPGDTSGDPA